MNNISRIALIVLCITSPLCLYSQIVLEADGPGNTYELITSVFAPGTGIGAVEHPECIHPEFGRHIAEVWDADLNQYVFEFYSHVTPDNDRCINFDRQRVEIKTYEPSPDNLKGVTGETITYKWKFKLPVGFQPSSSFTHIHQIKAVGGDDGDPLFTLTPRKGSPNKLELIHDNTNHLASVNLSLYEGVWVECTEVVYIDSINGRYSMMITRVSDGTTLLAYSNNKIMTIRSDNNFIRPKWGIYRSLDHPSDLRDEAVRFAGFSIQEMTTDVEKPDVPSPARMVLEQNFPNPFNPTTTIRYQIITSSHVQVAIYACSGKIVDVLVDTTKPAGSYHVEWNAAEYPTGIYFCRLQTEESSQTRKLLLLK